MALTASTTPYRQLWKCTTNVSEEKRYLGTFEVNTATGALLAFVRPSAGSGATAGQGDLFTVTQPTANQFTWLVQLQETAGQPIWVDGYYMMGATTAGTGGSIPVAPAVPTAATGGLLNNAGNSLLSVVTTCIDSPSYTVGTSFNAPFSNTFYVSLIDGAGVIPSSTLANHLPTSYSRLFLAFEAVVKPTVVPASL